MALSDDKTTDLKNDEKDKDSAKGLSPAEKKLDANNDGVVTEDEARANIEPDPSPADDDGTVWVHKTGEERTAEERVLGPAREHPERGDLIEDRADDLKRHNFKTPNADFEKGELTAESDRFHPDEPESTS